MCHLFHSLEEELLGARIAEVESHAQLRTERLKVMDLETSVRFSGFLWNESIRVCVRSKHLWVLLASDCQQSASPPKRWNIQGPWHVGFQIYRRVEVGKTTQRRSTKADRPRSKVNHLWQSKGCWVNRGQMRSDGDSELAKLYIQLYYVNSWILWDSVPYSIIPKRVPHFHRLKEECTMARSRDAENEHLATELKQKINILERKVLFLLTYTHSFFSRVDANFLHGLQFRFKTTKPKRRAN